MSEEMENPSNIDSHPKGQCYKHNQERRQEQNSRITFSSKLVSMFDASITSCSREHANCSASNAQSDVTAVTRRIPLAIPSSDRRANNLASRVLAIWVPASSQSKSRYKFTQLSLKINTWENQGDMNLHKAQWSIATILLCLDMPKDLPPFYRLILFLQDQDISEATKIFSLVNDNERARCNV